MARRPARGEHGTKQSNTHIISTYSALKKHMLLLLNRFETLEKAVNAGTLIPARTNYGNADIFGYLVIWQLEKRTIGSMAAHELEYEVLLLLLLLFINSPALSACLPLLLLVLLLRILLLRILRL